MITSLYAALLALFLIALSINVVRSRTHFRISLGDDNEMKLRRRIRAQGNFAEYTPLFLIVLGLNELNNVSSLWLHLAGCVFLIGRFLHAYSLLKAEKYRDGKLSGMPYWRISGMLCTFTTMGLLSIALLLHYFRAGL